MAGGDLMDMQDPGQMPSFLDMAHASQPVMMPNSPSPFAGLMYGQDVARHDSMVDQAAYMARLRQQMDEQKAAEFAQAAPGRRDEIELKNIVARSALGDSDSAIGLHKATTQAAIQEAVGKAAKAQVDSLRRYGVDSWDEADADTKALMFKQYQKDNHQFGAANANDMDFEHFNKYMTHLEAARLNEPNIQKVMYTADQRRGGTEALANARIQAAKIAADRAEKIAASKPQNMSMSQWEASLHQRITSGQGQPSDYNDLNNIVQDRAYRAQLQAQAAPANNQFTVPGMPQKTRTAIPPPPQYTPPDEPGDGGGQPAAPAGPTPISQIPPNKVAMLKANPTPQMRAFFDAKYGAGSANMVLSGR